jgi:hypothetical protein
MTRILLRIAGRGILPALLGSAIFCSALLAQRQEKLHAGEGQERLVPDSKDWGKDSEEMKTFQSYRQGNPAAPVTPEILEHGAQWYAYRFTHEEFQRPKTSGAKEMHDLLKDALDQVVDPKDPRSPSPGQLQFKDSFDKKFIARLREVTKNPKPVARVNAVIVLARLAATGDEEAIGPLLDVIRDEKENDGIKMHAFRGIRDFFALGQGDNPSPFRSKDLEGQCIVALLDFLNRAPAAGSEDAPAEEKAAMHYIRRDAVAALGETRYPASSKTENKKVTIERPTALTLLRIMRKDKVNPPPTLEEQVNAAVGLCRLKTRTLEQYHVDYTAQQIGLFLVDFTVQANSKPKGVPWKLFAARLSRGLEDLQNDVQGRQEAKYVNNIVELGNELVKAILAGTSPNPEKLAAWLDQNKPSKAMVYEGMPDSVVRSPEKAAE